MTLCKDCAIITNENGESIVQLLSKADAYKAEDNRSQAKEVYEEVLRILMEFNGCFDCKEALIKAIQEL